MELHRELPLSDLLQVLHQNRRTITVRVHCAGVRGELHLEAGELVHATFGERDGPDAARWLLAQSETRYELAQPRRIAARTIDESVPMLLIDSARMADEHQLGHGPRRTSPISLHAVAPKRGRLQLALVLGALVLSACLAMWASQSEPETAPLSAVRASAHAAPSPVAMHVRMKGSDTIGGKLGPAWAKAFAASHAGAVIDVEALGTATGFAGLFDDSADVAAASRTLREDERAFAAGLGLSLHEVVTGYDGIAVIVHPASKIAKLDMGQVASLFSGRITRWSELGGMEAPVRVLGRPSSSGTHAFFAERVFAGAHKGQTFRGDIEELESSEALVAAVAQDPLAIAYVGAGSTDATVRILKLAEKPGGAGVRLSDDAVRGGTYPLSRALLLYLRDDASQAARDFVRFTVSAEGQSLVSSMGFVPAGPSGEARAHALLDRAPATRRENTVQRFFFAAGSTTLSADADRALRNEASALRAATRLVIVGNADSQGAEAGNQRVALVRAQSVAEALQALGVAHERINVQTAGSARPLASNTSTTGRADNRRVDLFVVP